MNKKFYFSTCFLVTVNFFSLRPLRTRKESNLGFSKILGLLVTGTSKKKLREMGLGFIVHLFLKSEVFSVRSRLSKRKKTSTETTFSSTVTKIYSGRLYYLLKSSRKLTLFRIKGGGTYIVFYLKGLSRSINNYLTCLTFNNFSLRLNRFVCGLLRKVLTDLSPCMICKF